ncbi:MAG: PEP-CTERM sorting domain-containing protein, partial [Aquabacterium sp.]|uniref:PEP-CTERM sorting domain-containing protein n=1 Tax=Aquabacterium sp. TaxID=1872578 RepID=UPI00120B890A
ISLSTSIAFVGTVKVNMTNFSYNAADNMLYGDLLVTALGSSKTYTNQSILVAGTEVGTIGSSNINSVTSSATARPLNMNLSSFTLSSDLQTQLGNAVSFVSWLPAAVKNITVTSATPAVPEPSTYALMGLGLVGIALAARRKQA